MSNRFENVKKNFGFGCMRLPMNGEEVDQQEFTRMVDTFLEAGFNYFDTARGYLKGKSETAIRECLVKRYSRESFILTDKLNHTSRQKKISAHSLKASWKRAACPTSIST